MVKALYLCQESLKFIKKWLNEEKWFNWKLKIPILCQYKLRNVRIVHWWMVADATLDTPKLVLLLKWTVFAHLISTNSNVAYTYLLYLLSFWLSNFLTFCKPRKRISIYNWVCWEPSRCCARKHTRWLLTNSAAKQSNWIKKPEYNTFKFV